ncbi:MAG TPA: hypothetical protein ENJ82_12470 [Bacteroidetes bacterium]|nr:hypothetical protein [Bacteroidota bacterium]
MDRKKFLRKATLTAISLSIFGSISGKSDGTFQGDCETTNDILGPFYRANAPQRSDLTFAGLKGSRVTLKGRVFQDDCITPVPNALVEIWHCDTEGAYDNESDAYLHRASWRTNAAGEYSFTTILPGKYLNGGQYRPAHIHIRAGHGEMNELISQVYFKGDPHIEKDPWASQKKAEKRILEIILEDAKGNLVLNFDISLRRR